MTVRSYGPTAQAVTPATLSEVSVTRPDGTVPTFTTAVAIDGQGKVSFALDDGGNPPVHLVITVQKANGGNRSVTRVNVGPTSGVPAVAAGAAAGTGPSALSVTGSDDSGQVALTTGTATAAGKLCTVTFAQAKQNAPTAIALTAGGDVSAAADLEVRNITTTSFEVWARNAPTVSSAMTFYYLYQPFADKRGNN